jgi:hypothetical protein
LDHWKRIEIKINSIGLSRKHATLSRAALSGILNPYFIIKQSIIKPLGPGSLVLGPCLKNAFDEGSLRPRYGLDGDVLYDA